MKKMLLAALMAFTAQTQAAGAFLTGNSLNSMPDEYIQMYVIGISDTLTLQKDATVCMNVNVTGHQLMMVVKKHLNDHPEDLHYSAASQVIIGLRKAFTCK